MQLAAAEAERQREAAGGQPGPAGVLAEQDADIWINTNCWRGILEAQSQLETGTLDKIHRVSVEDRRNQCIATLIDNVTKRTRPTNESIEERRRRYIDEIQRRWLLSSSLAGLERAALESFRNGLIDGIDVLARNSALVNGGKRHKREKAQSSHYQMPPARRQPRNRRSKRLEPYGRRDRIYWVCAVALLLADFVLKLDKGGAHVTAGGIFGYFLVVTFIWMWWRKPWRKRR